MKVVVQRSKKSSVSVEGKLVNEIDNGMVLLVSFTQGDTIDNILKMTKKIANLRIFDDEEGVMNKSILDVGGEIYRKEDNIKVAREHGEYYLLQDNMNDDMSFDISIIKATDGNLEFYTENNGKIWKATSDGINLFVPELSKRIKR